jgi:hypothetical protein
VSLEFNQNMVLLAVDGDRQTEIATAPVAQSGFMLNLYALNRESFAECCAEVTEELFGGVAFLKHGVTSVMMCCTAYVCVRAYDTLEALITLYSI